jgi:hypothetical protein
MAEGKYRLTYLLRIREQCEGWFAVSICVSSNWFDTAYSHPVENAKREEWIIVPEEQFNVETIYALLEMMSKEYFRVKDRH